MDIIEFVSLGSWYVFIRSDTLTHAFNCTTRSLHFCLMHGIFAKRPKMWRRKRRNEPEKLNNDTYLAKVSPAVTENGNMHATHRPSGQSVAQHIFHHRQLHFFRFRVANNINKLQRN